MTFNLQFKLIIYFKLKSKNGELGKIKYFFNHSLICKINNVNQWRSMSQQNLALRVTYYGFHSGGEILKLF